MPKFQQEYYSNYSLIQLYNIVANVEKYPEFLPWCNSVTIVDEQDFNVIADVIINYKAFSEHYRSHVKLTPPDKRIATIKATAIEGPFKYLYNEWHFEKVGKKTKIHFYVDFEFKSVLLKSVMGMFFTKACEKMTQAFENRASMLYKREK